jgi:hypothetical protein
VVISYLLTITALLPTPGKYRGTGVGLGFVRDYLPVHSVRGIFAVILTGGSFGKPAHG